MVTVGINLLCLSLSQQNFWAAQRLSGPLAWYHGIPLYDSVDGPKTGWAYFPLGAILFSWTAWFRTPTYALWVASLASGVAMLTPLALLFWGLSKGERRPGFRAALYFTLAVALGLLQDSVVQSLFTVHVDGFAVGFGASAAVLFYLVEAGKLPRRLSTDLAIAVLTVAAPWTKQNFLALPVAMALACLWCRGWKKGKALLGLIGAAGLLSLALVALTFDLKRVYLNSVELISLFPWRTGFSVEAYSHDLTAMHKGKVLAASAVVLYRKIYWLLGLVGLLFLWERPARMGRAEASLLLITFFLLPLSIAGPVRIGGSANGYTPFVFFLILLLCAQLYARGERPVGRRDLVAYGLILLLPMLAADTASRYALLEKPSQLPETIAYDYIKRHPGRTFFPDNPTAQLLAEGNTCFVTYALMDWGWAKWPLHAAWVRAQVPQRINEIIVRTGNGAPAFLAHLPEFRRAPPIAELPNFLIFRR